jgi:hypothetical protein
MKRNRLLTTIGFAALVFASSAAVAQRVEYFIVQNLPTGACLVVDQRPTETTTTAIVDNGKTYRSRAEAVAGVLSNRACWQ